jgi:hypothetical protein
MRILAVCEDGINRSVAARWFLQHEGHEVIPVGLRRTSPNTLALLGDWADCILVLVPELLAELPVPVEKFVIVWNVGNATLYPHQLNPNLVRRIRQLWVETRSNFDSGARV